MTIEDVKKSIETPEGAAQFSAPSINWYQYQAGTYPGNIDLTYQTDSSVKFVAPKVTAPQTIHIIVEVTDKGTPRLTSYARFIIRVEP